MKILSVTSEATPLAKTGGLADVCGALPLAMRELGVDMRVLLPAYKPLRKYLNTPCLTLPELLGGEAEVHAHRVDGVEFLLLDAPHLYDRDGALYGNSAGDFIDNPERFAALSLCAAMIADQGLNDGWTPDLVHAHDWQAGLAPAYLKFRDIKTPSVITIHNIAFQGIAPAGKLELLSLPQAEFHRDGLEYWGSISTLKAGLVYADAITTVSPTYAVELMRPEFGMGLEGVIAARSADLYGILNGVDGDAWNPERGNGFEPFSANKLTAKAQNRKALLKRFGLSNVKGPLSILVSRLTDQKGIDVLIEALPAYFEAGGGLIALGSGDPRFERALAELRGRFPSQFGLEIGYDETLSFQLFAGGDAVLVPSRFEPCGLTQLYGLRFGTIPVVAATGGLADTVIDANFAALKSGGATGLVCTCLDAQMFTNTLMRLISLYNDTKAYRAVQKAAMKQDFSWAEPAKAYVQIYKKLIE